MKSFLFLGYPFVVGIQIYESFTTRYVAITGNVPLPNLETEMLLGGHDVIYVVIMRNSWG